MQQSLALTAGGVVIKKSAKSAPVVRAPAFGWMMTPAKKALAMTAAVLEA
jgi:hypothetical protein